MSTAEDGDRLIHEALTELGWDADPKKIAETVRRLDLGLPAEDELTAICAWLGKARLVHKLDQHQTPVKSRDEYQVPDLLVQFENTGPLLIEVKSKAKRTLSFRPDYLKRLQAYSELVNMPLLIAWKYHALWTLFEVGHFAKADTNFNISFTDAMKQNLLGVLAGDIAYKIAPGAGLHLRLRKEELVSKEEDNGKINEQWQVRVDKVSYTTAGGNRVENLDPEVTTLFTTWDLTESQTHCDSHIELHFVAGDDDGLMFGHMALTHLLKWPLPQETTINWRHTIRRDAVVSNMTNFGHALQLALDQKVVHFILHQQPQSWPAFIKR